MSLIIFLFWKRRRKRGKEKIFESHVHPVSRLMDLIWVLLGLRLIFRIEVYEVRMLRLD
jgi:hypothetical protein